MATLSAGSRETLSLAAGDVLSVTAPAACEASVVRLADRAGGPSQGTTAVVAETTRFGPFPVVSWWSVHAVVGAVSYSAAPVDLTALDIDDGSVVLAKTYGDAGSYQPVAVDLTLEAGAGTSDAGDTDFLAPIMGNVLGADLTKTHNYVAGVIGADSVTGAKPGELQKGALVGVVMDGVTETDAPVVSVLDGGDPSSVTRATAMFAARINNNNAGSGADFGLDLHDAGRTADILTGGGVALAFAKADIRLPNRVCVLQGAGVPVDGTTGDDEAGKGSLYIDTTNGKLYINTGAVDNPTWVLVGSQS